MSDNNGYVEHYGEKWQVLNNEECCMDKGEVEIK